MFNLSSRLSSKARNTLWKAFFILTIVLLALTVAIRLFILPDAIEALSHEGFRWSSIRLTLTMEDAITGVYWNHAVALMGLDSQLTSKPFAPAMLDKNRQLPGVTDQFYLDFRNKTGVSPNLNVPMDTLLQKCWVRRENTTSVVPAINQRMIGGLCRTEEFAYEKQIYSVLRVCPRKGMIQVTQKLLSATRIVYRDDSMAKMMKYCLKMKVKEQNKQKYAPYWHTTLQSGERTPLLTSECSFLRL